MGVGPTLQFTQKLLNSMIGLEKEQKTQINHRGHATTTWTKFHQTLTPSPRVDNCGPPPPHE